MRTENPLISVCINCDTRSESSQQDGLFNGTVNADYLTDGIENKRKFFDGFDIEIIVFIDEHNPVDNKTLDALRSIADTVIIRKHSHEISFNDYNYLNCLSVARGKYVCHIDGDMGLFTASRAPIDKMLQWLEQVKFVSYPSYWSPVAIDDPTFGGRMWASTRFFICKRETLNFDALRKCIEEPNWAYEKFGDVPRRCNWLEHFLTLANENSVYYPPIEPDSYLIFCWGRYEKFTLMRLNNQSYEEVRDWVSSKGNIQYPCDVFC